MKASQICETTEWITHRDLANKIYMHTGNRQLAMEFYNLEDEFVSQDDMQSTGLKALDVDPFEEDKARVNRILSIKRVPFRVLAMKHNDQYETLYSIVAPAMAESVLTEANILKFFAVPLIVAVKLASMVISKPVSVALPADLVLNDGRATKSLLNTLGEMWEDTVPGMLEMLKNYIRENNLDWIGGGIILGLLGGRAALKAYFRKRDDISKRQQEELIKIQQDMIKDLRLRLKSKDINDIDLGQEVTEREEDEMGGGEKLGRLIGRLKNRGFPGGAISIFIKNVLYGMNNPDSKEGQALQGIIKGLTTPSTMIGYFATLGVIGVGVVQLYKLQRWLLVNFGGLIGKTFDVPSKIRKKVSEADIRAFPTPEDYPIAKMDKLLSRYGVNYSMFINKPFDIKLYELLIDIYMNWEGSRIDREALKYFTDQYRDRGVRAGELPPSDK